MNNSNENLIDNTILTTPKPCASSTVERKEILRIIDQKYRQPNFVDASITEDISVGSLGIIDVHDKDDILPAEYSKNPLLNLQKQREMAQNTLEKSKITGLPAKFFVPSAETLSNSTRRVNTFSTVNESDLLRSQENKSSLTSNMFNPNDVSTPRNSNITSVETSNKLLYNKISDISREIRNSDVSLKDLCSQLNQFSFGNIENQGHMPGIDSGMFTPAELMEDQLLKDELSWRNQKDIPIKLQCSTNFENSNSDPGKYSEFFKVRSDNIANDFFKKSPDRNEPIPLIDVTNTLSESEPSRQSLMSANSTHDDSIMSISQIRNILAEYGTEDTPRIINCLINKKDVFKGQRNASSSTMTSEKDVDEYVARKRSLSSKMKTEYSSNQRFSSVPLITTTSPTFVEHQGGYAKINNSSDESTRILLSSDEGNRRSTKSFKTPETALCVSNFNTDISPRSELCTPNYLRMNNSPLENKENDGDRSLTSVRSASSLDCLPEGKFPIKSNRLELVWGCLKVGRTSIEEFQIRNQLSQRIRMQASVTGSCFRIVKDTYDSEMQTVSTFMLRPQETKTFSIMFCPSILGAAVDKINFYPILCGEVQHAKRQVLTLYGYGGHVNCDVLNVAKDSNGKFWLSFGKIAYQMYVEQKFAIKNNGTLHAFACLDICSKGPYPFSDLKIEPHEFIIGPQEEVTVVIRYNPSKSDIKHFNKLDIIEIGQVKLITGAEATRGRIRRLCTKLKQKDAPIDPLLERLSKRFPNERIPSDITYLKESITAVKGLLLQLQFKEITLTIEKDPESTLVNTFNIEESSVYHTLYQDDEDENSTLQRRSNNRLFRVEPTNILLTLPTKREDTVLLHSESPHDTQFSIKTECNSLFNLHPSEGVLSPYETILIRIFCKEPICNENVLERILIFIDNETVEIIVKSIYIKCK